MDDETADQLTAEITKTIETESPELMKAHNAIVAKYGDEIPEKSAFDEKVDEEIAKLGDLTDEEIEEKTELVSVKLEAQYPELFADKEVLDQAKQFQSTVDNYLADKELEQSYMGTVGRFIAPVFKPLGFDWKISTQSSVLWQQKKSSCRRWALSTLSAKSMQKTMPTKASHLYETSSVLNIVRRRGLRSSCSCC